MTKIEDYIFLYDGKPHVALLESDRIERVDYTEHSIRLYKSGRSFWLDDWASIEGVQIEKNFYLAKAWTRKCTLDILVP